MSLGARRRTRPVRQSSQAKARHHARWATQVRAAALRRAAAAAGAADPATAFDELHRDQQWSIVHDLVATRTGELLRAYPDALDVVVGFRRRGAAIEPEFCVKFLVRKKWLRRKPGPKHRRLPAQLLASAVVEGGRRVYAVPTDVEHTKAHVQVRPHGEQVVVQLSGASEHGMLACALHRPPQSTLFALGCRHVLSLSQSFPDDDLTDLPVQLNGTATTIGVTSGIEGLLRDASIGTSFDAQLVEIPDVAVAALRRALKDLQISVVAQDSAPPVHYKILAPDGPIRASFSSRVEGRRIYQIGPRWIQHLLLIETRPTESLKPGDSGSPVVSEDGAVLFGMHVAGTTGVTPPLAYMIPAWLLFDPANYTGISPTEQPWVLVPSPGALAPPPNLP